MASMYNELIHEYFDLTDRNTRMSLLTESDQDQLLTALTSKLYDKIVEKVSDIDFGTIPRSRGDITKIENYSSMMECVDILRHIVVEYKEDTYPIDVVSTAIDNMKTRTKTFTKAYTLNVELPIVIYNVITLAIVSSISFLISGCIEYIKDPGAESYKIALDVVGYNKTAQNLLFENLSSFNNACKTKDLDNALDDAIKNNRRLAECGGSDEEAMDHSTVVINIGGKMMKDNDVQPMLHGKPHHDHHNGEQPIDDEDHMGPEPGVGDDQKDMAEPDLPPDAYETPEPIHGSADCTECEPVREAIPAAIAAIPVGVKAAGAIAGGVAAIKFGGKAIIALSKLILPLIQNLVYFFYQFKQDVSDYFAIQAELIQMNAYQVQYNTSYSTQDREKIYKKQMGIADKFKKISNTFSIKYGKAKKEADKMKKSEKKKYKAKDFGKQAPARSGSNLF